MSEEVCVHVVITGRVQGVYYRAWTVSQAKERNLKGWVRNRTDGSVEALFYGPKLVVEDMLRACEGGPPSARVDHLHRHEWEGEIPPDFSQLSTL